MSLALDLSKVSVSYGQVLAVDDVSLVVGERELVAMIGGNGAGKSSIVRAIMGMVRPRTGTLRGPGGVDLRRLSPHQVCRTGIALVPSERQVFREMTVRENLEMGAFFRSDAGGIASDMESVLDRFPVLRENMTRPAGNLSGGQQQQLSIGRALMTRPRLILMDEPSLGLAPVMVEQVFALIQALHAGGLAVLLIEQNAKRALEISNRAYVLRAGKLTAEGDSADLLRDPAIIEAYLGRLVRKAPTPATRH